MKNQLYPGFTKGFLVSLIIWYMPVTSTGQMPPPAAGIINHSGTTQISCAVPFIHVTATGGSYYLWSNGLGSEANAIITSAGIYTVTITDSSGTNSQASITVTESLNGPPAPADVDGPTNVCNYVGTGERIVYSAATVTGATGYVWTVPPTVNIISGQGTNVITVTLNPDFTTTANKQLRVRAIADCGTSDYAIKYLSAQLPGSIAMIAGPADMCSFLGNGLVATYSISAVMGAVSYQWNVPAGATIVENNGLNIKVAFDTGFVSGAITVFANNGCGMSNTRSLTVKRIPPSAPGLITGPSNACMLMPSPLYPSGMTATYSVPKMGGNTYNWTVPAGVNVNLQGNTTSTDFIEVNLTSSYTGGDISVVATNGCGTSQERVFRLASYGPGSVSPISTTFIQACPDRQYKYSLSAMPSNAVSVQWVVPAEGTILSGQGTEAIVVSYPGYITGTVSASSFNGCGSSGSRSINVVIPQCQPEFTRILPGKTEISRNAISIPSKARLTISVLPVPSSTGFSIEVLTTNKEKIYAKLMDAQARLLRSFEVKPNQKMIVGAGLKAGVYFVRISQAEKISTIRFIQ